MLQGGSGNAHVAAAHPQIPPMAIPNKLLFVDQHGSYTSKGATHLTAKNCLYVLTKPDPSSNTMIKRQLKTKVHFRP